MRTRTAAVADVTGASIAIGSARGVGGGHAVVGGLVAGIGADRSRRTRVSGMNAAGPAAAGICAIAIEPVIAGAEVARIDADPADAAVGGTRIGISAVRVHCAAAG